MSWLEGLLGSGAAEAGATTMAESAAADAALMAGMEGASAPIAASGTGVNENLPATGATPEPIPEKGMDLNSISKIAGMMKKKPAPQPPPSSPLPNIHTSLVQPASIQTYANRKIGVGRY